jgi:phosphoribosylformylglycinamidine synthase II
LTASEPLVCAELAAAHGLKADEYSRIIALIGRTPSFTELGIFSAMWNEHCSYKSSRLHLRKLPTTAPWVIRGPGENAGVIDIGDGDACIFKMESHNHPSFIEPYQGATTGVGGILRDVFTMGARPIACLNLLRFGQPAHPRTRHLVAGVVAGVGGYGNSFGVPTVGGSTEFDPSYDGNILVNAMAVGLARTDSIFYSAAAGVGNPIVYLGSKTGRDGIHGATMASASFEADAEEKRPTVQVGDPFSEKLLLEACLELMASGAVIAIQDMGAAGLTSSAVEMGAKGNLGIELDLDAIPCRETGMTAYEMMLSESQERMLMVLKPELEQQAEAIFCKWGLDFAIVGKTTDTLRFVVKHQGEVKADLPIKELGDEAPLYDRPHVATPKQPVVDPASIAPPLSNRDALLALLATPNLCSKRWVWEQYDHLILGNSVRQPGGDAAVIRVGDGPKGLALTTDVTARYCAADPYEGGKQAVAECWRNITVTGATPLALTDNLNFGNPEKPEIMGQFVGCLQGVGEAARALDFPIVSGNVSLYNETQGAGILPTPAIGGVGVIADVAKAATTGFAREGDAILLIGATEGWLGQSSYQREFCGGLAGAPPPVNLAAERRNGEFVRKLVLEGRASAAHDLSDGGAAIALAEMALSGGVGATIQSIDYENGSASRRATLVREGEFPHKRLTPLLFGEDQARYIVAASAADSIVRDAISAGVPIAAIGVTGGDSLILPGEAPILLSDLRKAHERPLPDYMAGDDGAFSHKGG